MRKLGYIFAVIAACWVQSASALSMAPEEFAASRQLACVLAEQSLGYLTEKEYGARTHTVLDGFDESNLACRSGGAEVAGVAMPAQVGNALRWGVRQQCGGHGSSQAAPAMRLKGGDANLTPASSVVLGQAPASNAANVQ